MTVREMIAAVDALKPNGYTMAQKAAWIGDMEGEIWREVFLRSDGDGAAKEGAERELMLPDSWRRLYRMYLAAMIDFSNAEYTKYANAMAAYNSAYQAFAAWYAERFAPADRPAFWAKAATAAYNGTTGGWMLPRGAAVLMAVCQVNEAFEGETVLTLGTALQPGALMGAADLEAGQPGRWARRVFFIPQAGDGRLWAGCQSEGETAGAAEFAVLVQPGKE